MSFDPRDYDGDDNMETCPSCKTKHPLSYGFTKCSHPDCKDRLCDACTNVCGSCSALCCDEHFWETDYDGVLSRKIKLCKKCRDSELDEAVERYQQTERI